LTAEERRMPMAKPIVFISTLRVREGKLEGFKQHYRQGAQLIEASKPGTVAFLAYLNEDGSEVSIVHVFPDAEAMELHVQGADERAKKTYEFLEPPHSWEILGRPSETVLEMMKQAAASRTTLTVKPQLLGGYIRLRSG
jgi:quinol monooxygenase YgiN